MPPNPTNKEHGDMQISKFKKVIIEFLNLYKCEFILLCYFFLFSPLVHNYIVEQYVNVYFGKCKY